MLLAGDAGLTAGLRCSL